MATPQNAAADPAPWRPPRAWQPLTFRGVAAFSLASAARVYLVQFVVLLLAVACLLEALELTWWPAVHTAIRNLPETGRVHRGELDWHGEPLTVLTDSQALAILIDAADRRESGQIADLQIEFGKKEFRLRTFTGVATIDFEPVWGFPLNRVELVPWWGAWKPAIVALTALLAALAIAASWVLLATLYTIPLRLVAWLAKRHVTLGGCWRIAAISLLPGALLVSLGLLAYGFFRLPILVLVGIHLAHLVLGWVYSLAAVFHLDTNAMVAAAAAANPFVPATPAAPAQKKSPPPPAASDSKNSEPEKIAEPEPEPEPPPAPTPPRRASANPFAAPEA